MTWKLELLFEFEILDKGLISLIVGSLEIGEKLGLDSKYEVLESIAIGHGEKTIDKEVDNSRVKVF